MCCEIFSPFLPALPRLFLLAPDFKTCATLYPFYFLARSGNGWRLNFDLTTLSQQTSIEESEEQEAPSEIHD
jgi:hypothetical protein